MARVVFFSALFLRHYFSACSAVIPDFGGFREKTAGEPRFSHIPVISAQFLAPGGRYGRVLQTT